MQLRREEVYFRGRRNYWASVSMSVGYLAARLLPIRTHPRFAARRLSVFVNK